MQGTKYKNVPDKDFGKIWKLLCEYQVADVKKPAAFGKKTLINFNTIEHQSGVLFIQ